MDTTLEEFVQMTAMVNVNGKDFEKMYTHFDIDEERWQAIAMTSMGEIGNDAELSARFQQMMMAEVERLRSSSLTA